MMQWLGVFIIFGSIGFTCWRIIKGRPYRSAMNFLCLIAVFSGLCLILQERIIEITVKGIGTIKAASKQAVLDAGAIRRIKERIEGQSATIDLVAKQAEDAKKMSEEANLLSKELITKNELAEKNLKNINITLKDANKILSKLKTAAEFEAVVTEAQNDSRKAFEQLEVWANDKTNPFAKRALQAWKTILDQHAQPFYKSDFTIPWREGIDPSQFTLDDLKNKFKDFPQHLKPALLEYISKREDISKRMRIEFYINVIQNDQSLLVIEYAGRYFNKDTGQKFKPLAINAILDWWNKNKDKI